MVQAAHHPSPFQTRFNREGYVQIQPAPRLPIPEATDINHEVWLLQVPEAISLDTVKELSVRRDDSGAAQYICTTETGVKLRSAPDGMYAFAQQLWVAPCTLGGQPRQVDRFLSLADADVFREPELLTSPQQPGKASRKRAVDDEGDTHAAAEGGAGGTASKKKTKADKSREQHGAAQQQESPQAVKAKKDKKENKRKKEKHNKLKE